MSKNEVFSPEYGGNQDISTKVQPVAKQEASLKVDTVSYGVSKPKRIVRRARIAND